MLGLVYLGDNGAEFANYRKALTYNLAAYEISPGRITEIVLVRNYLQLQQYPAAMSHLHSLNKHFPSDPHILELLAQAEEDMGQPGKKK